MVDLPAGAAARLHLGPDKSPKQIASEVLGKKVKHELTQRHGGTWFYDRERSVISHNWVDVLKIDPQPQRAPAKLHFNRHFLDDHSEYDKQEMVDLLQPVVSGGRVEPDWCLL